MAKNAIYDYSTTPGDNADIGGTDISGATGKVSNGDNAIRSFMEHAKEFALDLGAVNTVGGTGDAITVTLAASPTALVDGMRFAFTASAANTGATTLTATPNGGSSLGAKAVRKISGGTDAALAANDILAGGFYDLIYDSAANSAAGAWILLNPSSVVRVVRRQSFTASGTYTPHAKMLYCIVEAVGGGGGGGGALSALGKGCGAGGASAGAYSRSIIAKSTIGASQTATIGAGGAAGTATPDNGGDGGTTSLGALVTATGGLGGFLGSAGVPGPGQSGGSAGTADLAVAGNPGDAGTGSDTSTFYPSSGSGGGSFFGGGAPGKRASGTGASAGTAASGYGSGGSGAVEFNQATGAAGGAGSAGLVIVTEYCSE